MDYVDRTFIDEEITFDGNAFTRCVFDGCVLRYNGGPFVINDGIQIGNGSYILYGSDVDRFDNPLGHFLIDSAMAQVLSGATDHEFANELPVTPKHDID